MEKSREQYVVDGKGQRTAVIMPIKEYEELPEDIHDLAIIAERRDEPTITFEELKKKLRKRKLWSSLKLLNRMKTACLLPNVRVFRGA